MNDLTARRFTPFLKQGCLLAFVAILAVTMQLPVHAQAIDRETAVDAIIGSEIKTDEVHQASDIQRVIAAIQNSRHSAELARKAFSLDTLEIVFVPELSGDLAKTISENDVDIKVLRESIEGSAMFYHAIDSRSIMLNNIIAAEFGDENDVIIFIKGTSATADRNIEVPAVEE